MRGEDLSCRPAGGTPALQWRDRHDVPSWAAHEKWLLSRAAKPFTTAARMNDLSLRRFVTTAEKVDVVSPWTLEEWICRGDVVNNQQLLLVRANMEPFRSHPFHNHPTREELIYIISGRAEQWVGKTHRILGPGEMAFIPQATPSLHSLGWWRFWDASDWLILFR